MRIAINGMGRIGRLLFRRLIGMEGVELVAVNDIMPIANLIYLLRYDSIYGHAPFEIGGGSTITALGKEVSVYSKADPLQLPWKDLDVDVVLECTGRFSTESGASKHLTAGAKKVLLSTTGADEIPLMIFGFNHQQLSADHRIISPGGCMTNASIPLIHLLQELEPLSLQLHVIHSYTSRQELVDAPHTDFRRGRAAAESIIPVPVDLAHSLHRLFPAMSGKIAALTTRVPVANGAVADFTFQLGQDTTVEQVNEIFKKASRENYKDILQYTEEPLVSLDVKGNPHSAVIDGSLTSLAGRQLKVIVFFDNEYGYTSRMIDWLKQVGEK
jgi:glyceraldehyde 3-phosphate dehydrogenase